MKGILRKIASNPSEPSSLHLLLSFAQKILRTRKRGGRKINLEAAIIKRTNCSSVVDEESVRTASSSAKRDAVTSKLTAVSAKLQDGTISAPVRIICSEEVIADYSAESLAKFQLKHPGSEEVIADYSAESLAKFQLKHPGAHERICFPPELSPSTALRVGEEDVLRAIRSIPAG